MNGSQLFVIVLVIALIGFAITFFVLSKVRPNVLDSMSPNMGSMNTGQRIGNAEEGRDKFLAPAGGTVMVYLFAMINNKTPQIGNVQNPINIMSIGNTVQLQLLPGGVSAPPKTILSIKTQNPNPTASNIEQFTIEDFPQQKWVHTAIVREGRRFTVYYNGKVVSSVRTTYYPVIDYSSLVLGDSRLIGEYVYPKIAPTPYRIDEIQNEINSSATTRFEPIKPVDYTQFLAKFSCPNGIFCFSTAGAPMESPLKMWTTPYA